MSGHMPPQQNGVLVLNKPKGPSSAACIAQIKRHLGQKKIGHAGTLDPMASGVLLVLLGQGTKLSGYLMGQGEKVYAATVKLGETTDTWDAEGEIVATAPTASVSAKAVQDIVASWIGDTEQEVPPYSAAKHQGKPLYSLARKGMDTPVKTKTVYISRAEVEWVDLPHFRFRVSCTSGTYIRSLAHSLGMRLGTGAHLTQLTREHSHPFSLAEAWDPDVILAEPERFAERVYPLPRALPSWPTVTLDPAREAMVRNGMLLPVGEEAVSLPFGPGMRVFLLDELGSPLALAEGGIESGKAVWSILRGLWNQAA